MHSNHNERERLSLPKFLKRGSRLSSKCGSLIEIARIFSKFYLEYPGLFEFRLIRFDGTSEWIPNATLVKSENDEIIQRILARNLSSNYCEAISHVVLKNRNGEEASVREIEDAMFEAFSFMNNDNSVLSRGFSPEGTPTTVVAGTTGIWLASRFSDGSPNELFQDDVKRLIGASNYSSLEARHIRKIMSPNSNTANDKIRHAKI